MVLCDTNGGTLPDEIYEIVSHVHKKMPDVRLGIHCHNDAGVAANSLAALAAARGKFRARSMA